MAPPKPQSGFLKDSTESQKDTNKAKGAGAWHINLEKYSL